MLNQERGYTATTVVEWERNLPRTLALMRGITLLNITRNIHVLIMRPPVGSVVTWDQQDRNISFGAYSAWDNYFTVYLWHELMHLELPGDDAAPTVIQLTNDCWLRQLPNDTPYPPFEGHEELFSQMQRYLSSWQEYLKNLDGTLQFYSRIPESDKNCDGGSCD